MHSHSEKAPRNPTRWLPSCIPGLGKAWCSWDSQRDTHTLGDRAPPLHGTWLWCYGNLASGLNSADPGLCRRGPVTYPINIQVFVCVMGPTGLRPRLLVTTGSNKHEEEGTSTLPETRQVFRNRWQRKLISGLSGVHPLLTTRPPRHPAGLASATDPPDGSSHSGAPTPHCCASHLAQQDWTRLDSREVSQPDLTVTCSMQGTRHESPQRLGPLGSPWWQSKCRYCLLRL